MLAAAAKPEKIQYPVSVQEKLDGIRCSIVEGRALTRSLKEIPNREIFNYLSQPEFEGLDGEIVVGDVKASDAYRTTVSFVMAADKVGELWVFHVFDKWDETEWYTQRAYQAGWVVRNFGDGEKILCLPSYFVENEAELVDIETNFVGDGAEGIIIRDPHGLYKFGRGSVTKGDLLKLKRFEDSEAEVIGVVEEFHNANEATTNALGRTERSSHKANKVGKGTLGALIVKDIKTGVEFQVGTGFDAQQRAELWHKHLNADMYEGGPLIGLIIKYKFFSVGVKDKPRHPVFLGFRNMEIDG